jgi:hypothetical protein
MNKRIKCRVCRWRNHWRALVNYSHGYAWSCVKRDRETGHTV